MSCLITGMGGGRGIKDDAKIFGLSIWKDGIPLLRKAEGKASLERSGIQFLMCYLWDAWTFF